MRDEDKTKEQLIQELGELRHRMAQKEGNPSFHEDLLNGVGQAVIATDLGGQITYLDRFAEVLYGWSATDALGRNIKEITAIEMSQGQARKMLEKMQSGESWQGEFSAKRKDGTAFQLSVWHSPIQDSLGNLIGMIGTSSDVTEQKQVEDALKNNEALFKEISQLASIGGWALDLQNMEPFFTNEIYNIYELPIGSPPSVEEGLSYYAPEGRPLIEEALQKAIEDGTSYDLELPFITAKGNARWIRAIGRPESSDGKVTRLYGVMQDITEQKQAADELQKQKDWLEVTLSSIGDAVIATDTSDEVLFIDAVAEALTGWKSADAMGRNLNEVFYTINERTLQPDESPVQRVLRERDVAGLAHHTTLFSKDGLRRTIADKRSANCRNRRSRTGRHPRISQHDRL